MIQPLVYLIRGVSGCGKNFFADSIKQLYPGAIVCSADDYFTDEKGNYNFNPAELGAAHGQCRNKFEQALINKNKVVIVCNTNVNEKHFGFYLQKAGEYKYKVISLVIERRHDGWNTHNVPPETLERQKNSIIESLKLI